MSINKINVIYPISFSQLPFELRPDERLSYRSPSARQALSITSRDEKSPRNVHISVSNGHIFVTTHRFIYVTEAQGDVESFCFEFSAGSECHFSHALKTPWFGPNYWSFLFFSPSDSTCDGFPKSEWFQGQISFKDGGLFEFVAVVDQAINNAVNNPHIDDELPRYSQT